MLETGKVANQKINYISYDYDLWFMIFNSTLIWKRRVGTITYKVLPSWALVQLPVSDFICLLELAIMLGFLGGTICIVLRISISVLVFAPGAINIVLGLRFVSVRVWLICYHIFWTLGSSQCAIQVSVFCIISGISGILMWRCMDCPSVCLGWSSLLSPLLFGCL